MNAVLPLAERLRQIEMSRTVPALLYPSFCLGSLSAYAECTRVSQKLVMQIRIALRRAVVVCAIDAELTFEFPELSSASITRTVSEPDRCSGESSPSTAVVMA